MSDTYPTTILTLLIVCRIRTPNTMHPVVHKMYAHLGQGSHAPAVKVLNVKKGQIGKGYTGKNFSYIGALFSRPKQVLGAYSKVVNRNVAHISTTSTTTAAPIFNTTSSTTTEKSISALASLLNIFTDATPVPHFLPTIIPESSINTSTIELSDQTELESTLKIRGPVWGSVMDLTDFTNSDNATIFANNITQDSYAPNTTAQTFSINSTAETIVATIKSNLRSRNVTPKNINLKRIHSTDFRGAKWNTVDNVSSRSTILPSEVTIIFLPTPLSELTNETFLPTLLPQLTENPNLINVTLSNLIVSTNASAEDFTTHNSTTTVASIVTNSMQSASQFLPPLLKSIRKYQRPSKLTTEIPTERPRFSVKEIKKTFQRGFKRGNKKEPPTETALKNSEVLSKRGSLNFDNSNSSTIHKLRVERISAPTPFQRFRSSRARSGTTTEASKLTTEPSKAINEESTSNSIDMQVEAKAVRDMLDNEPPNALLDKNIHDLEEAEKINSPNAKALKIIVEEFQELLSGSTHGPEKHILPIEAFFYSNKID